MKLIERLIDKHIGEQLMTLRLGEFGVIMPVDRWAHYEHNAFRLSAELGLRLAIRRIPADVPELYGTVVMRRPLLFEPAGGAYAVVNGADALAHRLEAGEFMLRCLSDIEQENAPRFTTFVSPDNHSTIFHYRYPGFINNESKSLCNADDDFSHDFDIRQERSRPESTRRAPVSPAPSVNAIQPSAPVWLEETTCEESVSRLRPTASS